MRHRVLCAGLAIALTLSVGSASAQAQALAPADELKIVFDDKAKSDGELTFTFTPAQGEPKTIKVTVANKMSGKAVAEDAAKELKVALGEDYKVDHYDADKIKVSTTKAGSPFTLALAGLTASGLSVRIK